MAIAIDIDCTLNTMREEIFIAVYREFPIHGKTVELLLAESHYADGIPQWKGPRVATYIAQLITSDWLLQIDKQPLAQEALHEIYKHALVFDPTRPPFYLTARKEPERNITQRWLNTHDFPDLELKMRPKHCDHATGEAWKAHELAHLDREKRIELAVDDHPDLIKNVRALGSTLPIIHYGHDGPSPYEQTFRCKDWNSAKKYVVSLLDARVTL